MRAAIGLTVAATLVVAAVALLAQSYQLPEHLWIGVRVSRDGRAQTDDRLLRISPDGETLADVHSDGIAVLRRAGDDLVDPGCRLTVHRDADGWPMTLVDLLPARLSTGTRSAVYQGTHEVETHGDVLWVRARRVRQ
jgi:hypothetical protein